MNQLYDIAKGIHAERLAAADHHRQVARASRPAVGSLRRRLFAAVPTFNSSPNSTLTSPKSSHTKPSPAPTPIAA